MFDIQINLRAILDYPSLSPNIIEITDQSERKMGVKYNRYPRKW